MAKLNGPARERVLTRQPRGSRRPRGEQKLQPASKTHREQACGANRPFAKKAKSLTLNGKLEDGTFWVIAMALEHGQRYCEGAIAILGWADRYRTTSNGPADCSVMNGKISPMAYR